MKAGDGDARHGTVNGYANRKCRCDECKRAWSTYMAPRVRAWCHRTGRAKPLAQHLAEIEPAHGTASRYRSRGCRCDDCRAASAAERRRNRAAAKERASA